MLQKLHGQKLHVSVAFYDKAVRLQQMHQEKTLSLAEAQTVDRERPRGHHGALILRPDHRRSSSGELAKMDEADRQFFDFLSPDQFLQGTPRSTVWWLQRAIYLLSHRRVQGRWVRYSFATWLVPSSTRRCCISTSSRASRWRATTRCSRSRTRSPPPGAPTQRRARAIGRDAWPRVAGCTRSTVYNRRDKWRQQYGIDIASPVADV